MIDWIGFLVAVAILAAVALALWTAHGPDTRSTSAAIGRLLLCLALALPIAGLGAWRLSNARSIQLLGTIIHRADVSDSVVALTFDDGPTPNATLRVLSDLAGEDVRATFFLNGSSMAEHPGATRALVAAGHEIGNHSYSHTAMLGLSQERIGQEIERTDQLIREAGYGGPIHFRAPYGKKLVALPLYLSRTNRTNVLWDVEPETDPAVGRDSALIVHHVLERARPGSIILLHVMTRTREPSRAAVPQIVRELHARGYRFVTISELLGVQVGAPAPPVDSAHVQAAHRIAGFLRGGTTLDPALPAERVELRLATEGGGDRRVVERTGLGSRANWRVKDYRLTPPDRATELTLLPGRHMRCFDTDLASLAPDLARLPHVGVRLTPPAAESCLQSWNLTLVFAADTARPKVVAVVYDQWEW